MTTPSTDAFGSATPEPVVTGSLPASAAIDASDPEAAPGDAPIAPAAPVQMPVPTTALGMSSCGGPGAGQGFSTGAPAPAAAGLLGVALSFSPAGTAATSAAPAAGSPTLSVTDPATRPG
jgi:hypothetical protein